MFLRLSAQGRRDLKVGHIQELLHWDSECELADHFARLPHNPCNSNCLINPDSALRLGFPSSTPSQSMVVTKHSNDKEHGYNIGQAWKQERRLILRFGLPTACHVMRTDPWFEQHCKRPPAAGGRGRGPAFTQQDQTGQSAFKKANKFEFWCD